ERANQANSFSEANRMKISTSKYSILSGSHRLLGWCFMKAKSIHIFSYLNMRREAIRLRFSQIVSGQPLCVCSNFLGIAACAR
ncbi:MAG: hypothetical protein LBS18_05250, partial [Clostridiales bacterium]|nr:hypothetical protein [Clostridiales bacterium]